MKKLQACFAAVCALLFFVSLCLPAHAGQRITGCAPWIAAWYTIPPAPYGEKVSWICKECAKEYTLTVKQTFDNVELDKITKLHDESSELICPKRR